MKYLTYILALILFSLVLPLQAQDGIRYKKVPDEINQQAITALETLLQKKMPAEQVTALFSDIVVCGPLLWEQLKKQGEKPLDGKPIVVMAGGIVFNNEKKPERQEAKGFVTSAQVQAFQAALLNSVFPTEKFKVRQAEEKDIRYFWATIPFDIEEPLLVIETAQQRLLLNFQIKEGKPKIYWVDYVGEVIPAK